MVYEGNNSTPLTLDYLIIQNGTSSNSTVSPTSSPKGSVDLGSIIGGVIGGLTLLVFVILGFFLLRRRQRRDAQGKVSISTARPFDYTPLHVLSPTSNPSSGFFPYSQVPEAAQSGSRVAKGQVSHVSMPSISNTDRTESPSSSSGVIAYPTTLRAVPFQQTALNLSDPSSSLSSSSAQPVPPPRKAEREAEALVILRPPGLSNQSVPVSAQSNDSDPWSSNPNVVLHADSGIRLPLNTTNTSVVDVPPLYTPD